MKYLPSLLLPALLVGFTACEREGAPSTDTQKPGAQATAAAQATDAEAATPEAAAGCLGDCTEGGEEHEHEQAAVVETLVPVGVDGKGITLNDYTLISAILADPSSFEGQRVLVKGEAVGVCDKRGCWVQLKSDQPYQSIRVKVNDGEIVFPQSCMGNEVECEGVVQKIEIPLEKYREQLAAAAKAKGEPFDPESVTEPKVIWQIKGLAARIQS